MPAINSQFNDVAVDQIVSRVPFLDLKTKHRGPVSGAVPADKLDIIDEAIALFRANVLMSSMEIKGNADHLLIYITLTISGASAFMCECSHHTRSASPLA